MKREWKEIHHRRWQSTDGAVVKIDEATECNTSRPWLPNYRGWKAYGPGPDQGNYLGFNRRNSGFRVARKFKTAQAAMAAVDEEYPTA